MEVKTLKRKWARVWWQFMAGVLLFGILGCGVSGGGSRLLCMALLAACGVGMIVCTLKLSCPYCGKGCPRPPRYAPSGRTQYCSQCGKPFVYDDEEEREKQS